MARKKSSKPPKTPAAGRKAAPKPKSKAKSDGAIGLPDRRALEGIMKGLLGELAGDQAETALDRAQALIYEAFDVADPEEQVRIAGEALKLSPDCADAHVLLAENARSRKDALAQYEKAVAAGERALGPEVFREHAGHFWGLLETRPYMRAREGLAHLLWTMGRRDEAVGHLQDLLRLNPGDNQGLRYTLSGWLLAEDRDEELAELLKSYDEDMAAWCYTKALSAFRKEGDTPEAAKLLKAARKANKLVPAYLLGQKRMPSEPPGSYSPGSEAEAILYAGDALSGWKSTAGALAWLKAAEPAAKKRKAPKPRTRGPLPAVVKRLAALPRRFDVWQADFRRFGPRVEEGGEMFEPWLVLVTSRTNDLVLAQAMSLETPTPDLVWDALAEAMRSPTAEGPHRPTELQVKADATWDALRPHLEEIGVDVVTVEELDQIDFLFSELKAGMAAANPPGLLEMPGVTPEQLAGFYEAAARFYRRAPWRKLGFEAAIEVQCAKFQSGPWYAIVMGQSGMTLGLALYDDLKTLRKLWSGEASDEENARETVALTLTFDEQADVPDADLDAIEEFGFAIAGPEAFPSIFRKERGLSMRPPLAWELELMEACLRAIPEFVARHPAEDADKHAMAVPAALGSLDLVLSWVGD